MNYKNAYKEVYEILQNLVEDDYNKIPKEVINAIEENKNDEYEFYLDDELELKEQNLLPETRAILYNLFRDYLSEPWQREKIIKWQNEERQKNEELKKQKYNIDVFDKEISNKNYDIVVNTEKEENIESLNYENNQLIKYKENIFTKVFKFIKKLFKKKKY